jgi:hypothetical protein
VGTLCLASTRSFVTTLHPRSETEEYVDPQLRSVIDTIIEKRPDRECLDFHNTARTRISRIVVRLTRVRWQFSDNDATRVNDDAQFRR